MFRSCFRSLTATHERERAYGMFVSHERNLSWSGLGEKNNKIIIWLTGLGTNATKPSFHEKPHEFGFMWISINIFHIYNSISVHSQRCSAVLHDFLMDSFSFFLIHFYSFSESHLFPVLNITSCNIQRDLVLSSTFKTEMPFSEPQLCCDNLCDMIIFWKNNIAQTDLIMIKHDTTRD